MRSLPLVRTLSLSLALVVLGGCNTAYREAMSRARDAAINGDFLTAAFAYRDACRAAPDDEEACSRAPTFAQKATDQALADARPACDAGDLDRCIQPLLPAHDLMPSHPEVNGLLEKAGQVHAERCAQWKPEGPLATAVAHLACLQLRAAQLPVPGYQALLTERADRLGARFGELAATARGPRTAGAAAVLWSAAQCFAPGDALNTRVQQARQDFLSQSAIPIVAELGGSMSNRVADALTDVCGRLSSGLPPWTRCVRPGTAPGPVEPLQLSVSARIQRPRETVARDVRSVRYVSGTREVPNPAYETVHKSLHITERQLRDLERPKRDKEAACEQLRKTHGASCVGCPKEANQKTVCDEAKELAETWKRLDGEREAARQELTKHPATLTEEIHDTFTYPVRMVRWSSDFQFTLQANTQGGVQPVQQSGALRFEDEEHVGFSPAGLKPNPLEEPPVQAYADAFLQQLAPHVFEAVRRDGEVRGAARRAECGELPEGWGLPWVQCWAEASLWGGQPPEVSQFLQLLATQAGGSAQPLCR
jgi:hypothetical protein